MSWNTGFHFHFKYGVENGSFSPISKLIQRTYLLAGFFVEASGRMIQKKRCVLPLADLKLILTWGAIK